MRHDLRILLPLLAASLSGCAVFSIQSPTPAGRVSAPVTGAVTWNADMSPGTLKVTVDGRDVTSSFAVDAANRKATAPSLPVGKCGHDFQVSGDLWTWYASRYANTSTASTFTVTGCEVGGHVCQGHDCVCPSGAPDECGDNCVDFKSDARNCGSCGNACPASQVCQNGTCGCPSGSTMCGTTCRNLNTDPNNCSACNKACSPGQGCCGATCKDMTADALNCGTCGNMCPQTCSGARTCLRGGCQPINNIMVYVEHPITKCIVASGPEQAYNSNEAVSCAQNQAPGGQYSTSAGYFNVAVTCPGYLCGIIAQPAFSQSDAQTCVQNNYGGCAVGTQCACQASGTQCGSNYQCCSGWCSFNQDGVDVCE